MSQAVARRLWPNEDPIGKHIRYWQQDTTAWRTVIGVAGDMRWRSLRDATPSIYLPWRQGYWQGGFAVRSSEHFTTLLSALRSAAHEIDPRLDLWASKTLDTELAGPLAQPRLTAYLLSSFGAVALLLAAIGLYGAMSSIVRARTRDIGVKMALGASPNRVRSEMLKEALGTFVPGAAVGIIVALLLRTIDHESAIQNQSIRPDSAARRVQCLGGRCAGGCVRANSARDEDRPRSGTPGRSERLRRDVVRIHSHLDALEF